MGKLVNLIRLVRFVAHKISLLGRLQGGVKNYFALGRLNLSSGGRIAMGSENVLDDGFDIEVKNGTFRMGNRNYLNRDVKIVCLEGIVIGDDCLIADSVHIYDHNHCIKDIHRLIREQGYVAKPIRIGNNVWVGAKATILKGVTIGDGAVIGANAVVTRDVPALAIVGGNPGRIIRIRA